MGNLSNLIDMLREQRQQQMTHTQSFSQSMNPNDAFSNTSESWAHGIYNAPGNLARLIESFPDYQRQQGALSQPIDQMVGADLLNSEFEPQSGYQKLVSLAGEAAADPTMLMGAPRAAYGTARAFPRFADEAMSGLSRRGPMAQRGMVDFTPEQLAEVPDVPQVPLDRYEPKRMPPNLEPLLTPEAAERLKEYALKGEAAGGRGWYNLDPLREQFVSELGEEAGNQQFERFADILAATSPRSRVDTNIRRASYLRNRELEGIPLNSHTNDSLPQGYGHLAHKMQTGILGDLADGGHFAAENRPKISSFAENLKGNQEPMTIDTHNFSAVVGDPKFKQSPSKTQYKYLEDFQKEMAKELDMTPAQYQASVWMGGDTGVADSRPFLDVFNTVIERTAKKHNKTPEDVLKDFIHGDQDLWQKLLPVPSAVIGYEALTSEGDM